MQGVSFLFFFTCVWLARAVPVAAGAAWKEKKQACTRPVAGLLCTLALFHRCGGGSSRSLPCPRRLAASMATAVAALAAALVLAAVFGRAAC